MAQVMKAKRETNIPVLSGCLVALAWLRTLTERVVSFQTREAKFVSATTFALSVGVLLGNTRPRHKG